MIAPMNLTPAPLDTTGLRPLHCDGLVVGWLPPAHAEELASFADCFVPQGDGLALHPGLDSLAARDAALAQVCATLYARGRWAGWRGELYGIWTAWGERLLWRMERSAARYFGVVTWAVHLNAVVRAGPAPRMWVARRSPLKAIDPGLRDNLVAGGISAGESPEATLWRECWEEAGIPLALAQQAQLAGLVHVARPVDGGLHREGLFIYDLDLPPDLVPVNQDGEAQDQVLLDMGPLREALAAGQFTLDAALVAQDWLRRHGL